jgi:hypothetical protein
MLAIASRITYVGARIDSQVSGFSLQSVSVTPNSQGPGRQYHCRFLYAYRSAEGWFLMHTVVEADGVTVAEHPFVCEQL